MGEVFVLPSTADSGLGKLSQRDPATAFWCFLVAKTLLIAAIFIILVQESSVKIVTGTTGAK